MTRPALVVLEAGENVLTLVTDDIEGVIAALTKEGATVRRHHEFSQPPTTPDDLVLEGECRETILGPAYGRRC